MPYQMLGHPTLEQSPQIIQALAAAGADLFELGLPFSDPLADGPVIQAAAQLALDNGVTVERCLAMVRELRAAIPETPFCLMGYVNPMLAYGLERFVVEAAAAGVDGLIVPDLPPDEPEAEELIALCRQHGLATVFLLAPTSTAERIELGVARSQGFVYLVSVAGITGARERLARRPERLRAAGTGRSGAPIAWPRRSTWPSALASARPRCRPRSRRSPTASSSAARWSSWPSRRRRSRPGRGRLCG